MFTTIEKKYKMTDDEAIHICRNPYGYQDDVVRRARLFVCEKMESYNDSYLNMRQFAIDSGLNITASNNC